MKLQKIKNKLLRLQGESKGEFGLISYSQEGEDMVLRRLLQDKSSGFYVDVGAHHPERFSNTNYYYKLGWNGINFDADPSLINVFKQYRPRDINIAAGVGKPNDLTFYIFNEKAINTFDEKLAQERSKIHPYKIIDKIEVPILPLEKLLDKYLKTGQQIDFMSIDVEGKDLEVLKSNNWEKYRPSFLLVECLNSDNLRKVLGDKVTKFLSDQNYEPVAKTLLTVVFKDMKYEK